MLLALSIAWTALFGGPGSDQFNGVARTPDGGAVAVGTSNADAVVVKYDANGSRLWTRTLGGSSLDEGRAVAVSAAGEIYFTGYTGSANFPAIGTVRFVDGFVAKLGANGVPIWARILGGSRQDWPSGIAEWNGIVFVVGTTESYDFPTTVGVVKRSRPAYFWDACDAFVTRLDANGNVIASTYLGTQASDAGNHLALDASGNPVVTGWTASKSFPTTTNAYDRSGSTMQEGFLAKLTPTLSAFVFSTYIGDQYSDEPRAVEVLPSGELVVVGKTGSAGLTMTAGAPQIRHGGGADGFVHRYSGDAQRLLFGTFYGSSLYETLNDVSGESVVGWNGYDALLWRSGVADMLGPGMAFGIDGDYIVGKATGTFQGQAIAGASDGFILRLAAPMGFSGHLADAPALASVPKSRLVDLQGRTIHGRPPPGVYFRITQGQRARRVVVVR